jgi:hypothetical protein
MPKPQAQKDSAGSNLLTRLAFLSAIILMTLTACAGPTPTAGITTGISGIVQVGPIGPKSNETRPVQVPVAVFDPHGSVLMRLQSDAQGRFSAELAPGTYGLKAEFPPDQKPMYADQTRPVTVTVTAGQVTTVTLDYDTGVR